MLELLGIHHIAIICSDYEKSKYYYTEILGFKIISEEFRAERNSYKLDLALGEAYIIELFSFPTPPARVDSPEACGLRHLAFAVRDILLTIGHFESLGLAIEALRVDPLTGKRYTFTHDPDGLPIEFYEQ
ncbi:VOC family protein [Sphingobacteriaceae bacterium WQ 2009]|uniref:VOC family protein n=1 Tax=Rhinopithecimicrobium faecis TaxID=2820698 RepID=A0A8T4H943_9SPHI|nr:VOC family protein [Sphingobacteriaceae bacterium WQ 2009]